MNQLIVEPNYTQIPNVIFDHWMNVLSLAEFTILLCICRKTFGWHKYQDKISFKQIEKMTGLARSCVIKNINLLMERGLINRIKNIRNDGGDDNNQYEVIVLQKDTPSPFKEPPPVVSENYPPVVAEDPQKKDLTKERHTKEIYKEKIPLISFGQFVRLTQEKYDALCKELSKSDVDSLIEDINAYCINDRPKGYHCYATVIRGWHKRNAAKGQKSASKSISRPAGWAEYTNESNLEEIKKDIYKRNNLQRSS